jgi:CRISPR-associated protein Cas8a1/Csx13
LAFTGDTRAEDPSELLLPLYFALVGTLALPLSRVEGALIVPLFEDLELFAEMRPSMTPTTAHECQVGNPADGALQAQLRLRGRRLLDENQLPVCLGMRFAQTPWASQQRSRVDTLTVPAGQDVHLDRFDIALHDLPTRIVTVQREEATGRGRQRQVTRQWTEAFRAPSLIRPLVAENLARRRPWYTGFVRLMTALDDNNRPLRDRLGFELEGLQKMIDNSEMWDQQTEITLVKAIHEALRSRYKQIRRELPDNPAGRNKRFQREYERRRLAFSGAKTADSFRNALAELISRAGRNPVLRSSWQIILPLLSDRCWQKGRDLALLALASYSGTHDKGKYTTITNDEETGA